MHTNGEILSWILIVAALVVLLPTARIRRARWIAARPRLVSTSLDELPRGIRMLLKAAAEPLENAGFVAAGSAHAPHFAWAASWTQVLFLNRTTGERASVLGVRECGADYVNLIFATEFSSGPTVVTHAVDCLYSQPTPDEAMCAVDVDAALDRHREQVRASVGERVTGRVIPPAGGEWAWLVERAALAAQDVARLTGFGRAGRDGRYRLPWRTACAKRVACPSPSRSDPGST